MVTIRKYASGAPGNMDKFRLTQAVAKGLKRPVPGACFVLKAGTQIDLAPHLP
jgi:hypothetical protein